MPGADGLDAQELLARFIERRLAGEGESALAELCARHPARAAELRALAAEYEGIRELVERPAEDDRSATRPLDADETLESRRRPPAAPADVERGWVGRTVGHLRIVGHLGSGGMGEVFVARDERLERRVALKTIRKDRARSRRARERFLREAQALSRLDHPHICRIYDYHEGDALDFLVLELIEGRPLDQAAQSLDVARKLEIAEQIADALVAAHREGIVHRDLKPGNVLISDAGEVKVLDFGLARLERPGQASAESSHDEHSGSATDLAEPSSTGGPAATVHGAVLGTPRYMSPEQARGEPAGPASDLYSFGLLLHELFSERPPHPPGASPTRLVRRAARAEVDPPVGVPRDVAALIAALEAARPADRPTAREARERLRFLRDKPRRLLRRAVAAAVLLVALLAALKYTVDLRRERGAAREAQQLAESRRGQAETLIGFMIGELRAQLAPTAQLAVLDDIGAQALDYFAAVSAEELSDEERYRRAQVLSQLADVRIEQGQLDAAAAPLEESLALTEGLVEHDPRQPDWLLAHGTTLYWLGAVAMRKADYPTALARWSAYADVARRLVELDPDHLEHRAEIVYTESNLGSVLRRMGRLDEARAHFVAALEAVEELAAAHPQDDRFQLDLARTLNQNAILAEENGELSRALDLYRREVEIAGRAVELDRARLDWRRLLASALLLEARVAAELGRDDEAWASTERACSEVDGLLADDPGRLEISRDRATCDHTAADLLLRRGDVRAGASRSDAALRRWRELAAANPSENEWQLGWARAELQVAGIELGQGAPQLAAERIDRALESLTALRRSRPGDSATLVAVAEANLASAAALRALGRPDQAATAAADAVELLTPLAAVAANARVLGLWARALMVARPPEASAALTRLAATGSRNPTVLADARRAGLDAPFLALDPPIDRPPPPAERPD